MFIGKQEAIDFLLWSSLDTRDSLFLTSHFFASFPHYSLLQCIYVTVNLHRSPPTKHPLCNGFVGDCFVDLERINMDSQLNHKKDSMEEGQSYSFLN